MVKIRLRRMGARNRPFYRVVVSDTRRVPQAPAIDEIGFWDPSRQPAVLEIDRDRVDYWVRRGAGLSDSVRKLVGQAAAAEQQAAKTAAP
ncbi:MAG TPA: 30S ribosomal protein S16 [Thermoanaerobaculia bacterium]|nr:30S ribosomal protein S16 [Thermoanaerobaculia bacterium]